MNIPPWSYTALDTFENCPKQYYHRYILKEKAKETEQMKHGTTVHTALEERLKDKKVLPVAYGGWEHFCNAIEKHRLGAELQTELELALDAQFKPCSFFGVNVWGRGKADVAIIKGDRAWVGDWKTGKTREKEFQVKVFGAFLFKMFPQLNTINANNIWLQENKLGTTYTFLKHQEPLIWNEILHKINRIELAAEKNAFNAKPSGLCGWCDVKSCVHNQRSK
jgi:hypothetical protein